MLNTFSSKLPSKLPSMKIALLCVACVVLGAMVVMAKGLAEKPVSENTERRLRLAVMALESQGEALLFSDVEPLTQRINHAEARAAFLEAVELPLTTPIQSQRPGRMRDKPTARLSRITISAACLSGAEGNEEQALALLELAIQSYRRSEARCQLALMLLYAPMQGHAGQIRIKEQLEEQMKWLGVDKQQAALLLLKEMEEYGALVPKE